MATVKCNNPEAFDSVGRNKGTKPKRRERLRFFHSVTLENKKRLMCGLYLANLLLMKTFVSQIYYFPPTLRQHSSLKIRDT